MLLSPAVVVAALLVGAWAAVQGLRDRPPGRGVLRALLAVQLLIMAQAGLAVADLLRGARPSSTATFLGYLVLSLVLLPGALALTVEERTRYGSFVLAAGCLVVAVVETRLRATA